MSNSEAPSDPPALRLQLVLLLIILWDGLALVAELTFGGPLFKVSADGHEITGVLAARGAFGGAMVVTLTLYVYALVRGPTRYRGLLWVGVLEQNVAAISAVYHAAVNDVTVEGSIVTIVVSLSLVVLLLVNMPRGRPAV